MIGAFVCDIFSGGEVNVEESEGEKIGCGIGFWIKPQTLSMSYG